jgi:membrane associated rhomboid family serine protease
MVPLLVLRGEVWRFGTYMFAHGSPSHLIFNMIALYIFGSKTERFMGTKEFTLYYMLTGILAGVLSFAVYMVSASYTSALLGASGALFAIQLAFAIFFPDALVYFWGILPLRAPVMVLGFTGLELFLAASGLSSNVAHLTHLAGFLFGWLYFLVRFQINPWKRLFSR